MEVTYLKVRSDDVVAVQEGMVRDALLLEVGRNASTVVCAPNASFWLVLRGDAQVKTRLGSTRLSAGQWVYLDRDARPELMTGGHAVVLGIVLDDALQARLLNVAQSPLLPGRGDASKRQRLALLTRWRHVRCSSEAPEDLRSSQSWSVHQLFYGLSSLQRHFDAMVERCPGRSLVRRRQLFARMQRARFYLECNLDRPVPIGELSALCSMSIWYFTKTFRALYGECPQAMSTRVRLECASELLRSSMLSIAEVGAACGFENNCSFSRAFRGAFGHPPSLHRASHEMQRTNPAHRTVSERQACLGIAV